MHFELKIYSSQTYFTYQHLKWDLKILGFFFRLCISYSLLDGHSFASSHLVFCKILLIKTYRSEFHYILQMYLSYRKFCMCSICREQGPTTAGGKDRATKVQLLRSIGQLGVHNISTSWYLQFPESYTFVCSKKKKKIDIQHVFTHMLTQSSCKQLKKITHVILQKCCSQFILK